LIRLSRKRANDSAWGIKAGTLLSALLALMTDANRGSLAGFADKFNQAGFGDAASSWISSGVNAEASNEQLESALGTDTLDGISDQIGTDYNTTVSAAAFRSFLQSILSFKFLLASCCAP